MGGVISCRVDLKVDPVRGRGSLRALAASNGIDKMCKWEHNHYIPRRVGPGNESSLKEQEDV